jgi:hypothetical protein
MAARVDLGTAAFEVKMEGALVFEWPVGLEVLSAA